MKNNGKKMKIERNLKVTREMQLNTAVYYLFAKFVKNG